MKNVFFAVVAFVAITFFSGLAFAGETKTVNAGAYGIEFSISSKGSVFQPDFKLIDLSKKNKPKKGGLRVVAQGFNKKKTATLMLAVRSKDYGPFEKWKDATSKSTLKWYSGKRGFNILLSSNESVVIGSGETVTASFKKLDINGNIRYVATVFFVHNGRYSMFFVANKKDKVMNFVMEELLPGLRLF